MKINIQGGIWKVAYWEGSMISEENQILQMILNRFEAAMAFGKSVILLDLHFLSVLALQLLSRLNAEKKEEPLNYCARAKKTGKVLCRS